MTTAPQDMGVHPPLSASRESGLRIPKHRIITLNRTRTLFRVTWNVPVGSVRRKRHSDFPTAEAAQTFADSLSLVRTRPIRITRHVTKVRTYIPVDPVDPVDPG
jgi:hypothetical protein